MVSATYCKVVAEADLADNSAVALIVNGWPISVSRSQGRINAFINKCTHLSSPLAGGRIARGVVQCPLHGARFSMETGTCVRGSFRPLKLFDFRIIDGWIEVAVPDDKPGPEHQPARG